MKRFLFCALSGLAGTAYAVEISQYQPVDVDWRQIRPGVTARQTWQQTHLQNYVYQLDAQCQCALNGKSRVYILNGSVASVTDTTGKLRELDDDLRASLSIQGLFATIDKYAALKPDSMSWQLHRTLGYPQQIGIDPSYRTGDDEIFYKIGDLQMLVTK